MTIEFCTRAKAESLSYEIPGILGRILVSPPDAGYVLVSVEKGMRTFFSLAIVLYGEILYLSNEDYRREVEAFLASS